MPSELLKRRPDIAASLARLESAHSIVGAAQADRLPALRLTAKGGYTSSEVSDLFDGWIANLAGSIISPILDGGRRKSEVRRTEAIVKERLADYGEVVMSAIHEVENAIMLEHRQNEYSAAILRRLTASEKTQAEASARYRKGVESYVSALRAQTEVQALQRQVLDANHDLTKYRVNLYRSLAGSWSDTANDSAAIE